MMLQPVELLDLYDKGLLLLGQQVPQVNVSLLLSAKICIDGTGCLAHYCPKILSQVDRNRSSRNVRKYWRFTRYFFKKRR